MSQNFQKVSSQTVKDEKAEVFKDSLRGELIQPGAPDYDDARTIYNAMIDKHPALIVKCENTGDVISAH